MIRKIFNKIFNGLKRVFTTLLYLLTGFRYAEGTLTVVSTETKSIHVATGFMPKYVYIMLGLPDGIPVCQGNCDSFDWRPVPDGFVLIVKLQSECREIKWFATT